MESRRMNPGQRPAPRAKSEESAGARSRIVRVAELPRDAA